MVWNPFTSIICVSRSISLENKEQIRKFISEAAIQYDDIKEKSKDFKKHEKFLAEKIIESQLGIKKTVYLVLCMT